MATILVIDENPVERRVMRMTLEIDGHRVVEAAEETDALELIRSYAFDIVMMPMGARRLGGYDLMAQTRAMGDRESTQFITVLDAADEKGPVEAFMNGASDLLIRPFGAPEMRDVVSRAMTPTETDLRDRLVGIQLEAYEMAVRLQEQARAEK